MNVDRQTAYRRTFVYVPADARWRDVLRLTWVRRVLRALCWLCGGAALVLAGVLLFRGLTPAASAPLTTAPVMAKEPLAAGVYRSRNTSFDYPPDAALRDVVYHRNALLTGRMLYLDALHPLPEDAPVPNVFRIATQGKGMVPVADFRLTATPDTTQALYDLFVDARCRGVEGMAVWQAALSAEEQRLRLMERINLRSANQTLRDAAEQVSGEMEEPAWCEYRLGTCVDLRLLTDVVGIPDARPLRETEQGRYLLMRAWRFGLILRYPGSPSDMDRGYRFRYVGKAHSIAMTELGLDLRQYLELLHQQGVVTISRDGAPRYVIVCAPLTGEYASFRVPVGATLEASADNLGYGVIACTLPE